MSGVLPRLKLCLLLLGALMFIIPLSVSSQSPAGAPAAQEKEPQYSCPMHPEVRSKTAGSCPKCGMTLKKLSPAPAPAPNAVNRYGAGYFPNVTLTNQDGKTLRFYDDLLKDKVVAIDLIYTHCVDKCPLETAMLVQVKKLLGDHVGKDIYFYSISIDPKRDTPAALKAYAERFHTGPGWQFLTGKESDIELISKKLGLYSYPDPADRDGHTPTLMIGNVATGDWVKHSALDNPRFLARKISELIGDWSYRKDAKNYTAAATIVYTKGQHLFETRCAACHTIGHGDRLGPDLFGVAEARDRAWLLRLISVPDQVLAEKDPLATALFMKFNGVQMPNLRLSEDDAAMLLDYIKAQTAAVTAENSGGKTGGAVKPHEERR
jgi:protein SCO1/2